MNKYFNTVVASRFGRSVVVNTKLTRRTRSPGSWTRVLPSSDSIGQLQRPQRRAKLDAVAKMKQYADEEVPVSIADTLGDTQKIFEEVTIFYANIPSH